MKKFLILAVVFLLASSVYADTSDWTKYFKTEENSEEFVFSPICKQEYNQLNKSDKKYYQQMVKINKLISKEKFKKAHSIYNDFIPIYMSEVFYYVKNEKYSDAIICMCKIIDLNKEEQVLDEEMLMSDLSMLYFKNGEYNNFLNTIEPYKNNKNNQVEGIYYMYSYAYKQLKNYDASINYAKKIENNNSYKIKAYNLLYSDYIALNNLQQATLYAKKLANIQPCIENYAKVILFSQSKDERLKYCYLIADEYINAGNKKDDILALKIMYNDIIPLENEKIANATKKIKGYIELPDYKTIFDNDYKYMTPLEAYTRCKNFYAAINNGISKYTGNDLKECFNCILKNEKNTTDRIIEEHRANEQNLAEQRKLEELRRMNANMQYSNYLQQQQNYQLSRPRYTNTTVTPLGNTYYMNSYSY